MKRPNPAQSAVALAYQTGDLAPKVVARGRGFAEEHENVAFHGLHFHPSVGGGETAFRG